MNDSTALGIKIVERGFHDYFFNDLNQKGSGINGSQAGGCLFVDYNTLWVFKDK